MKTLALSEMEKLFAGDYSNRTCTILGGLTGIAFLSGFLTGSGFVGALTLSGMAASGGCFG